MLEQAVQLESLDLWTDERHVLDATALRRLHTVALDWKSEVSALVSLASLREVMSANEVLTALADDGERRWTVAAVGRRLFSDASGSMHAHRGPTDQTVCQSNWQSKAHSRQPKQESGTLHDSGVWLVGNALNLDHRHWDMESALDLMRDV
jgi:hypothetical protein